MSNATRLLRGIAMVATAAFSAAALSFLVPQRNVTTVSVVLSFVAAMAVALSPLMVLLVITWRATDLPLGLRRLVTSQSILLSIIGGLLLWADPGQPISLTVALMLLGLATIGLVRVRGKAHHWIPDDASAPNLARAARVGVALMMLALSQSVMAKFRGMDSEGVELSRLRGTLRTIEDAQAQFWTDSGHYADSLSYFAELLGSDIRDSIKMTVGQGSIDLSIKGSQHAGICTMRIVRATDPTYETGALPDCERGPLTRKAVVPGFVLYMLGALLSGWIFLRPLTPSPNLPLDNLKLQV